jgi:hypothetical protein
MSSAGRIVSSNGCVTKPEGRETGLHGCFVQIRSSSLTGSYVWKWPNNGSCMNREVHVRFWESPEVKVLADTRQIRTQLRSGPPRSFAFVELHWRTTATK